MPKIFFQIRFSQQLFELSPKFFHPLVPPGWALLKFWGHGGHLLTISNVTVQPSQASVPTTNIILSDKTLSSKLTWKKSNLVRDPFQCQMQGF